MKILMIGLGSIGQRHLRNIRRIYGDSVNIIAYRVRRLKTTFSDTMQIRENVDLEKEYDIKTFTDISEALCQKPDVAFICNITSEHISCALAAAKAGCHLFLEKPLSNTLNGIDELIKIIDEKKVKAFLGFQNRYNPAILKAKEYLDKNIIGNIISVHAEVGERLSTMHSYEDYKTTYMARNDMGGGVILNQMIHEIDYLRYLFGDPEKIFAVGNSKGDNLDIDVDDCCDAVLTFGGVPVSLHADFYQYPSSRYILIVGSNGKIKADIIKNSVTLSVGDKTSEIDFNDFTRNDMFIEEIKRFFDCVEKDSAPDITVEDGVKSLKIALAVKQSVACGGKYIDMMEEML